MALSVRFAGAWRAVKRFSVGGVPVKRISVFRDGQFRQVAAFTAVAPLSATKDVDSYGYARTARVTTNAVTIAASGGAPPYNYAWSMTYADTEVKIDTATAPSTTFTAFVYSGTSNGTALCVVTDSAGSTASVGVNVSLSSSFRKPGGIEP